VRPEAWARSRCRSPRRSEPKCPACAARRRRTWSEPSARITSSTTPREDFADGNHRYDAILDIGGNRRLSHLRRALTHDGTLVIVGGEKDGRWLGGVDRQLRALLLSPLVSQKLGTFVASETSRDLMALRELLEAGKIVPAIDRTYPLSDVPAAIRYVIEGHARGKVVITV
jgi:NADPH:quinone reductase-like Zn-dependent oxidoreductase